MALSKRPFIIFLVVSVALLISIIVIPDESDLIDLENILAKEEVKNSKQKIFFLETHLEKERNFDDPRQACTIESAALTNSDADVYLIFATDSDYVTLDNTELTQILLEYSNIHFVFINPSELSKGTKAENFFKEGKLKESKFPLEHMADALRMLILNRFGGQYLDLDVFSLKPLSNITKDNFACLQKENYVENAIINLNTDENGGKAISDKYLELLNTWYFPKQWAAIGPTLFTKVIKSFCPNTTLYADKESKCGIFTTFASTKCYAVEFVEWMKIFQNSQKTYVMNKIKESDAYFFHVWGAMRKWNPKFAEVFESDSAYVELSKKYCPKISAVMLRNL